MSPDPLFEYHAFTHPGSFSTSSQLRAWWLAKVKKWSLVHHCHEPVGMSFGQMKYKRTWVFVPPRTSSELAAMGGSPTTPRPR